MTATDRPDHIDSLNDITRRFRSEWETWKANREERFGTVEFLLGDSTSVAVVDSLLQTAAATGAIADEPPTSSLTLAEVDGAAEETKTHMAALTFHWVATSQAIERLQGLQVKRLRLLNVPWQRIGEALGITAQSAHQKARDKGWLTGAAADQPI